MDHYRVAEKAIGQGTFSIVRTASCVATGLDRAVKVITKEVKDAPNFRNEIDILASLSHDNIVQLFEVFEDYRKYYLVMELCTGGELFDRVVEVGDCTESQAARLIRQIVQTVGYMHGVGVVHRDLKPENFVFPFKGPLDSTPLKLIDFGLARRFAAGETLTTAVGTVLYVAPEVFTQAYTHACDLWSVGVITYCILCGYPPFDGKTAKQVAKSVRKHAYSFHSLHWDSVSEDAKDLIRKLLVRDVGSRLTASQARDHCWILSLASASSGRPLGISVMERLMDLGAQNQEAKTLQRRLIEEQQSRTGAGEP